MTYQPGSMADKADNWNKPPHNTKLTMTQTAGTNSTQEPPITLDLNPNAAVVPIKLVMKIGNSHFVEINGTIKPACLPSMHH